MFGLCPGLVRSDSVFGVKGKVKGVGRGSPMKSKVTRNSGSPRIVKSTDNVKDTDKEPVVAVVADKLSDLVKGKTDVVKDKVDVGKKPVEVVKDTPLVNDKVHYDVVKDKARVDVVSGNEKSASDVVKDMATVKDKMHSDFVKDKARVDVVSAVKGNSAVDVVLDKVQDDVVKDKALDVVKKKLADVKEKSTGNVVKGKLLTVFKGKKPKVDVKEKSTGVKEKSTDVKEKLTGFVDKSKADLPKPKHKVSQRNLSKEDYSKKKVKMKLLKGKSKKEDSDSELDTDEVDSSKNEANVYKLKKKIKKEESDEKSVPKKRKKKENELTPKEAAHDAYLLNFPTLRARTVPSFLFFFAIRESRVDRLKFLSEIGFSLLHNVAIDKISSMLGSFVVANFNEVTYRLSLDSGNKIEVTHLKDHEILGVPVGGYSLFSLEHIPVEHEFVKLWVSQFYPKSVKDIRVSDITSKLVLSLEVDFLFKVNFLTLFTNTTALYLDSTKFDGFLVVQTRPAIINCSSNLMKQRQELELKEHVMGLLELHDEWNEAEAQE
nr:hypothetical protein [Tanacetum cinerariifolium]